MTHGWMKLVGGAAFESAVQGYEPRELPHTLPGNEIACVDLPLGGAGSRTSRTHGRGLVPSLTKDAQGKNRTPGGLDP